MIIKACLICDRGCGQTMFMCASVDSWQGRQDHDMAMSHAALEKYHSRPTAMTGGASGD